MGLPFYQWMLVQGYILQPVTNKWCNKDGITLTPRELEQLKIKYKNY